MSIKDLDEAFRLIEENFDEGECLFGMATSEEIIKEAEKIIQIQFPLSYRFFVKKRGFGGPGSFIVPGIRVQSKENLTSGGIVYGVMGDREDLAYPEHIIRLHDVGNGDTYCLDTSQMNDEGECPVVVWPIGGYAQTPVLEIVAEDFGAFFLDMVKQEIAYKNSTP